MPRTYDPEYHRRYAQSEKGRAARQRARARWLQKRKEPKAPAFDPHTLSTALAQWRQ